MVPWHARLCAHHTVNIGDKSASLYLNGVRWRYGMAIHLQPTQQLQPRQVANASRAAPPEQLKSCCTACADEELLHRLMNALPGSMLQPHSMK